ncbi:substrate-binding domain-containing protein [Bradyrhizobium iriomotense]|uniref:substrate-binding domain-containing protein n=1 Tax=Bradyrhizobium iriomotense TaxID=441950 RepID=UPI001B8A0B99|nr:substrate-binding domain-containing protein [Bradyrhizobium iriomotense]MBR0783689.1 substrate-binding domain-containing protein [Bradyrhizobium iriomotense]
MHFASSRRTQSELPNATSKGLIGGGTGGHHIAPSEQFVYTFGSQELQRAFSHATAKVIIHHGDLVHSERYAAVHPYFEGTTIHATPGSGLEILTIQDLRLIFAGKISNWNQIGGNDLPIDLAMRGDPIFFEAANYNLVRQGIKLERQLVLARSYEELASFGAAKLGALIFGLRGPFAHHPDLRPLKLDGGLPQKNNIGYPLRSQMTTLVRTHDARALDLALRFAASLREQFAADGMLVDVEQDFLCLEALQHRRMGTSQFAARHCLEPAS